jgi:hypothetical protein
LDPIGIWKAVDSDSVELVLHSVGPLWDTIGLMEHTELMNLDSACGKLAFRESKYFNTGKEITVDESIDQKPPQAPPLIPVHELFKSTKPVKSSTQPRQV